jgi:hypothetical protein
MNFKKQTIRTIKQLANDDKYGYFFNNIETKADDVPEELIGSLAAMLSSEIGEHSGDLEKIKFFIRLGFFSHE